MSTDPCFASHLSCQYLCFYRTCQCDGIWAWDAARSKPVLVLPWVLAMLGDNPMQSELACHIGMRGRFFCRTCWVYKHDGAHAPDGTGNDSARESEGSEDEIPTTSARRKVKESMTEMLDRVKRFVSVRTCFPRPVSCS